ncbi:MAG TPA: Uma2 family endonuclease [Isosphaeraceae bacterium]|jgi:Uma2 family endonuclease|nr:Uma2 family endonuclease [Isosphaeraceae bacterium]
MDQVTERIELGDVPQGDDLPLGQTPPGREFDSGSIRALTVLSPSTVEQILSERVESGACRWDEVWDGVYVVMPDPNDLHQEIVTYLIMVFSFAIKVAGLGEVRAGGNVSDREDDWTHNFRVPDVAVYLRETAARNLGTHWLGGPDFVVEVISPQDWSQKKREFYAKVGTRELLYIDRAPWSLELLRLQEGELVSVGISTPERPEPIASAILPLTFRLVAGEERPRIEVVHSDGVQRWTI